MTFSPLLWSFDTEVFIMGRLLPLASIGFLIGCDVNFFTEEETEWLQQMKNIDIDPDPDPVNRYVGDPEAEILGQQFFFDTNFSGDVSGRDVLGRPTTAGRAPVGEPAGIACATCHDPARGGIDHSSVPGHVSVGAGLYDVNAQPVINAAYYDLKYWNGRYDSLVWQVLAVMESGVSMNSDRVRTAWRIHDFYRQDYEGVFGDHPLPDFGRSREEQAALLEEDGQCSPTGTPPTCPTDQGCIEKNGGCWPRWPLFGRPGDGQCSPGEPPLQDAFDCMAPADQETVTRVFVNFAKAIGAYEYRLISRNSLFDRFVEEGPEDSELLPPSAKRGAKLFVGKASCVECHHSPLLSDQSFHNIGVPQVGAGVLKETDCPSGATCDCVAGVVCLPWGAFFGLSVLQRTALRVDHPTYSDNPALGERHRRWYEASLTDNLKGAWRTPTLRDVALTAPYMHNGFYRSLEEVVAHYNQGGTGLGAASDQVDPKIRPLGLTEAEMADLVEFLKTLTGEALPRELVVGPELQ